VLHAVTQPQIKALCDTTPVPGVVGAVVNTLKELSKQFLSQDHETILPDCYEKLLREHMTGYFARDGLQHDCAQLLQLVIQGLTKQSEASKNANAHDTFVTPLIRTRDFHGVHECCGSKQQQLRQSQEFDLHAVLPLNVPETSAAQAAAGNCQGSTSIQDMLDMQFSQHKQ
jgi:hypothetical protein